MSNEQKEIKMTQAEKIASLIEITELLTKRCIKIEKNAIDARLKFRWERMVETPQLKRNT